MHRPWAISLTVAAVAIIAGTGACQNLAADDREQQLGESLSTADLITEADLPPLSAGPGGSKPEAWQEWDWSGNLGPSDVDKVPTIVCQGGPLRELKPKRLFRRDFRVPSGPNDAAEVKTAVLEFEDVPAANRAFKSVRRWLANCTTHQAPRPAFQVIRRMDPLAGNTRNLRMDVQYSAMPEVCESDVDIAACPLDATWLESQSVWNSGNRLIVVSHAELLDASLDTGQSVLPDQLERQTKIRRAVLQAGRA